MTVTELHITVKNENDTVLHLLKTQLAHDKSAQVNSDVLLLSNAQLKLAIAKGALWLTKAGKNKQTNRLRRIKSKLNVGDILHFYYNEAVLAQACPDAQLIADFHDYSIWYKPYGMLSQGSKWSDHCTINRYVEQHLSPQRPCFIVHRLDRAATGLIIIAHSKKAARAFSTLFENKSSQVQAEHFKKYYQIIVHGDFSSAGSPLVIQQVIDDKTALSIFNFKEKNDNYSLIDVEIKTGRKHQIRKHAAYINYPVLGDRLHGITEASLPESTVNLQLCAVQLIFTCPLTQSLRNISLPEQLRPSFTKLG